MRYLLINADDFGIGPPTSEGILEVAARGGITSSVLLANSPHAEEGIARWRAAGARLEMGWHPTLTLDQPVLPAEQVPSLVDHRGVFWGLGAFLQRKMRGQINLAEVEAEFRAQYTRCCDLLGHPPDIINTHHHVQAFYPIGTILKGILRSQRPAPYMRLVREPWPMLWRIPGAQVKRLILNWFGRRAARRQRQAGLLGNDWLIGVTDPACILKDPEFFVRWVQRVPGNVVELTCHPGKRDETLIGRDCTPDDGMLDRRVRELELLSKPEFLAACKKAGFAVITPSELRRVHFGNI